MDGEADGMQTQGEEQQGVQGGEAAGADQSGQEVQQVGGGEGAEGDGGKAAGSDAEYRAALADRDKKIAELDAQIADAAKTIESANALAKQIEKLKAAKDAERGV